QRPNQLHAHTVSLSLHRERYLLVYVSDISLEPFCNSQRTFDFTEFKPTLRPGFRFFSRVICAERREISLRGEESIQGDTSMSPVSPSADLENPRAAVLCLGPHFG